MGTRQTPEDPAETKKWETDKKKWETKQANEDKEETKKWELGKDVKKKG